MNVYKNPLINSLKPIVINHNEKVVRIFLFYKKNERS